MSNRDRNSLDDTLPMEMKESGPGSLESNKENYGSDLSVSIGSGSTNPSVKIVYELINLSDSKSDMEGKTEHRDSNKGE